MERRRFIGIGLAAIGAAACEPVAQFVPDRNASYPRTIPGPTIEDVARELQRREAKGETRIPIPEGIHGSGLMGEVGLSETHNEIENTTSLVFFDTNIYPRQYEFPAVVEGEITFAGQVSDHPEANRIQITKGSDLWNFTFVETSVLIAKTGQKRKLGDLVFRTFYLPKDNQQKRFGNIWANDERAFVIISRYKSGKPVNLSIKDNVLFTYPSLYLPIRR